MGFIILFFFIVVIILVFIAPAMFRNSVKKKIAKLQAEVKREASDKELVRIKFNTTINLILLFIAVIICLAFFSVYGMVMSYDHKGSGLPFE
jgi:predicted PurR-regulated permease PerM